MNELKLCSYCGSEFNWRSCKCDKNADCPINNVFIPLNRWNTRPLEEAKDARIAELEEFIGRFLYDAPGISDKVEKILAKGGE